MASNITRRDLLNGIAVGAGGLMLPALGTTQTPADAARLQQVLGPGHLGDRRPVRAVLRGAGVWRY